MKEHYIKNKLKKQNFNPQQETNLDPGVKRQNINLYMGDYNRSSLVPIFGMLGQ